MRGRLGGIGLARQIFLGTLVLLMLGGHIFLGHAKAFPFVAWRMYGTVQTADPVVYEYRMVLSSASVVPLVPSRILPGMTGQRFSAELIARINRFRIAPDGRLAAAHKGRAEMLLTALGRTYNETHSGDPSKTILVFTKVIPLYRAPGEPVPGPELLWRMPLK